MYAKRKSFSGLLMLVDEKRLGPPNLNNNNNNKKKTSTGSGKVFVCNVELC